MGEFLVAIGLVLVIEGLLFAAFPAAAKRLAASAIESPENFSARGRYLVRGDRDRDYLVDQGIGSVISSGKVNRN